MSHSYAVTLASCLVISSATAADQATSILSNGGFERGLAGWVFRPGSETQVSFQQQENGHKQALVLCPQGKLLGVETEHLRMGREIDAKQAYQVTAEMKHTGLQSGIFAFSMYCFDRDGKSLQQIAFYGLNTNSDPHGWRKVRGTFGPGTQNPLPEGTQSICIRFSFHESSGNCRGEVAVDNVELRRYEPAIHEGWPGEIIADIGDLQLRFESRSFWTLYRVDFKGTRLGLDGWGGHYGSVVRFPEIGFIGSGHTENEEEQVVDLRLAVDGQPVETPDSLVRCRSLTLRKESRIRSFLLKTEIQIQDNRIIEDVRLRAERPTAVSLIYHFMHPWTTAATHYVAQVPDGTLIEGQFQGDRGQRIDRAVKWSAIYDETSSKGVVTYVLRTPQDDDWRTRYWDVPDVYRKHYLVTFLNRTVPAGQEFHYRVVVAPFESQQRIWTEAVARVAAELSPLADRP
jgi:hypothetical protein